MFNGFASLPKAVRNKNSMQMKSYKEERGAMVLPVHPPSIGLLSQRLAERLHKSGSGLRPGQRVTPPRPASGAHKEVRHAADAQPALQQSETVVVGQRGSRVLVDAKSGTDMQSLLSTACAALKNPAPPRSIHTTSMPSIPQEQLTPACPARRPAVQLPSPRRDPGAAAAPRGPAPGPAPAPPPAAPPHR